ncbi:MAG: hypothetical protein WC533_02345 [Candidatus Pacearchaeota archaeon]
MNTLITIKTKIGCEKNSIEYFGNDRYLIKVSSKTYLEANKQILEMLSRYTGVPQGRFSMLKGENSEDKLFKII